MFNKVSNIVIIILILLTVVVLLITVSNSVPENDGLNPISYPTEASVEASFTENSILPDYAYIANNYVYVSYSDDSYMPVNLSDKSWKDVKISPNGKQLAIIGKENGGSNDLYVYNLSNFNFNKMTFFQNEASGVTDFYWVDDRVIAFHQDEWLHSLNTTSREIVKIQSGISNLVGIAGQSVAMNNSQNSGMIYDFAEGKFVPNVKSSLIDASTLDGSQYFLMATGIFTVEDTVLSKVSDTTGDALCGDSVIDILSEVCRGEEVYKKTGTQWYTLENEKISKLSDAFDFDVF